MDDVLGHVGHLGAQLEEDGNVGGEVRDGGGVFCGFFVDAGEPGANGREGVVDEVGPRRGLGGRRRRGRPLRGWSSVGDLGVDGFDQLVDSHHGAGKLKDQGDHAGLALGHAREAAPTELGDIRHQDG